MNDGDDGFIVYESHCDGNVDDDVDLTRSKPSGKEVVIGRVPADGSDFQFLVSRD